MKSNWCHITNPMSGKLADIDVSARHVANMLPTFPTKSVGNCINP